MDRETLKSYLLADPTRLLRKKPFTRGSEKSMNFGKDETAYANQKVAASLPSFKRKVVSQEQFLRELDPSCHDVLFDENIPSICVKTVDNGYVEIKYEKMAMPIQKNIRNKQVLHLTGNKMQFSLVKIAPSAKEEDDFTVFKQYWEERNQDGMFAKMVTTQLSVGDAGLLYYRDYENRIKCRLISYEDGYVICSHNDENGDRLLECVYYEVDEAQYIDCYDDTMFYRFCNDSESSTANESGWKKLAEKPHGFPECPLVTKRGDVAWNNAQTIINAYESLYNVFNAIQKRFGWGIFYIKGRFKNEGKQIAGSVVLNDTSIDGNGDAKFLTPPTPQGTIETLNSLMESIMRASSTTFILPKDIKSSGDISALAIMLTQSMDMENALQKSIEWQNAIDKMVRLFKFGLAAELVSTGKNPVAITDYINLNIHAHIKPWRPMNDHEYNQMLIEMCQAGILSKESGIELSTLGKPNEKTRIEKEKEEEASLQQNTKKVVENDEIVVDKIEE